jgi:hypothetical protein
MPHSHGTLFFFSSRSGQTPNEASKPIGKQRNDAPMRHPNHFCHEQPASGNGLQIASLPAATATAKYDWGTRPGQHRR